MVEAESSVPEYEERWAGRCRNRMVDPAREYAGSRLTLAILGKLFAVPFAASRVRREALVASAERRSSPRPSRSCATLSSGAPRRTCVGGDPVDGSPATGRRFDASFVAELRQRGQDDERGHLHIWTAGLHGCGAHRDPWCNGS
jgi:hypothetical protein